MHRQNTIIIIVEKHVSLRTFINRLNIHRSELCDAELSVVVRGYDHHVVDYTRCLKFDQGVRLGHHESRPKKASESNVESLPKDTRAADLAVAGARSLFDLGWLKAQRLSTRIVSRYQSKLRLKARV